MNASLKLTVLGFTLATLQFNADVPDLEDGETGAVPGPVKRGVKRVSKLWVKGMIA